MDFDHSDIAHLFTKALFVHESGRHDSILHDNYRLHRVELRSGAPGHGQMSRRGHILKQNHDF